MTKNYWSFGDSKPFLLDITLDNSPEILPRNITVGNNGNLASGPHLEVAAAPSHSQASVQPRDPHWVFPHFMVTLSTPLWIPSGFLFIAVNFIEHFSYARRC